MPEVLPSVIVLTVMAAVALWLTSSRGGVSADAAAVRSAVWVAAIAIAAQAGHFAEELTTGLHERLPVAFGLPPMSLRLFVSFNVAWLVIWALSAWGLARRYHVAQFPLWFLGIASVANGLLHPLLALKAEGYFPASAPHRSWPSSAPCCSPGSHALRRDSSDSEVLWPLLAPQLAISRRVGRP